MGSPGRLIVCPTPIGNLNDVTQRILDALTSADVIACEDSRSTGKLFELLGIERTARFVSYHDHNASERVDALVDTIVAGETVVLVSDAGTPTLSDPGYRLVAACVERDVAVVALPGPFAGAVALSASGLSSDRFLFEGFLGKKSSERRARLTEARDQHATLVVYESPKRLVALLDDVEAVFGDETRVCVGRELTKKFESYYRGTVGEVRAALPETVKGECVVIIEPPPSQVEASRARDLALALKSAGIAPREIKAVVKDHYGVSKSLVFEWINEP